MIINCPECGGAVSDKAASCPHCGCPIKVEQEERLLCPKCMSDKIETVKQGFSAGKAIAGTVVFGLQGALAGSIGASKDRFVCLRCGHTFNIGEAYVHNSGEAEQDLEINVGKLLSDGRAQEALSALNNSTLFADEDERKKFWVKMIVKYAQKPK